MKLSAIKALVAAVQEGSLRAAARKVELSQPALSKVIRELELELGVALLERTTRGVAPTAQGRALYEHSLKALREFDEAVNEIRQLDGDMVGDLHIGAVPMAVMLLVPETLRTFSQAFPSVRVRLSEELYIAQLQRLRAGEVDLMLGGVPADLPRGEYVVERLARTTMVPTVRKGSPLLGCRRLAELQDAKWVYTGANGDEGYARQWFEAHDLKAPRVGAFANSTLALLSLVASGDCVGLMPHQIAAHEMVRSAISVIPTEEPGLNLEIAALIRRDVAARPLIRHLVSHLYRAAHQLNLQQV
ncbi:LysR family transcriptional regulator [Pseudacidovorax sp. RU35E]|uniref:LysR family transcriptional regulator n=1 Tax=Pseudacidovorax sp. RU35E TaxID=1907403 RepID=UPI00095550B2|nr:LysR family transcriptional regulator [Pseudacidovorax sp. RU35E]SIQ58501.1 transcriptional regulator, LysR family [Pseudacidovorax sp. RU35E]